MNDEPLQATKPDLAMTEVYVTPALAVQLDGTSGTRPDEIGAAMESAFKALGRFSAAHALIPAGPPRTFYTRYAADALSYTVAFPIVAAPTGPIIEPGLRIAPLPGGPALRFVHHGPYAQLQRTYDAITDWLKSTDRMADEADWAKYMPMWEEYVTDPDSTPPDQLITYIYLPDPTRRPRETEHRGPS